MLRGAGSLCPETCDAFFVVGYYMRTAVNGIPKERISITVDAELLEKVRIQAEQDDRSLSQYINRVLKKAVREKPEED